MKTTMLTVVLVSFFVLTSHFVSADEKVQVQRTTTIQYEMSGLILSYEQQQLLKYTILSKLEKNNVYGIVVSVGESSVTLLNESNLNFLVPNIYVLQTIHDVLGKEPELLK